MSTTHTPGPWVMHPTTLHPAVRSVGTADTGPRRICTVGTMNGNPADQANARLIAAAPELLEALIAITTVRCDGMDPTPINEAYEKADAAIAKATGKPA